MAIVDTDNMMSQPKGLTSASGLDVLVHALEAYASVMATDYTDGLALKAMKNVFEYLQLLTMSQESRSTSEDGRRFLHGWYGICKCILRCLPLYGT